MNRADTNRNQAHLRRIQNETINIKNTFKEYADMFAIQMVDDNMYHWRVVLNGPPDSLYENFKFNLEIVLSQDYPTKAPNVKFVTPIQHLNVNATGDICLDILKDNWSSAQNIISIVKSISLLLSYPNPDDPFNAELAMLYRDNKDTYESTVKQHCNKYKI